MKKLLFILMAFVVVCAAARVTTKTYDAPANISVWGTAADTVDASEADTLVMKVTSETVGKMNLLYSSESISGNPNLSAVLSGSVNQLLWIPLDTLTTTVGDTIGYFELQDVKYNYYRVIVTANATAQRSKITLKGLVRK